jgi:hypothetical protein
MAEFGKMIDWNEAERRALKAASNAGGDYIEAQKTSDMARWTPPIWQGLIESIVGGYVESLCAEQAELMAALGKVQPDGGAA